MSLNNVDFVELIASRTCQLVLDKIDGKLQNLNQPQNESEDLLTREEACNFLKIDSSTLWRWTKENKIKLYGIGSRRYYKKSELINSLIELKN